MSTDIQRDELLRVLLDTPVLKKRIDEYLKDGWKINAIKELKLWCHNTSYPAWLKDVAHKLRLMKDHIKFIVNDLHWYPSYSEYKEYNRMWKRYNAFK